MRLRAKPGTADHANDVNVRSWAGANGSGSCHQFTPLMLKGWSFAWRRPLCDSKLSSHCASPLHDRRRLRDALRWLACGLLASQSEGHIARRAPSARLVFGGGGSFFCRTTKCPRAARSGIVLSFGVFWQVRLPRYASSRPRETDRNLT